MEAEKKPKKEKLTPRRCRCGKEPLIIKKVGGTVISCPTPLECVGNYWASAKSKDKAIQQWNLIVWGIEIEEGRQCGLARKSTRKK